MIESNSITVSPSMEQEAIETFETFGWTLKSSQEIHTKDSHIEQGGWNYDKLYNVTETTHYVKLLFQRDKQMENYQQLVDYENEYWSIISSEPVKPGGTLFWIILSVIGLILYIVPGLIVIGIRVYFLVNYHKRYDVWLVSKRKIPEILENSRSLLV